MAEWRVYAGVCRIAVIGVDEMTGATAAGAIVAGMIVGARKRHDRVEQACFLEAEKNRVGAQPGAQTAVTELVVRLARVFFTIGIADLGFLSTPAFEHTKDIAGLGRFPAEERIEFGYHAFGADFFGCGPGKGFDRLRFAATIVAFTEARVFHRIAAVVV